MDASPEVRVGFFARVWLLRLHLDSLLLAELRQRLLDPQGCEAGGAVGVPALPHNLGHHPQGLQGTEEAAVSAKSHSSGTA